MRLSTVLVATALVAAGCSKKDSKDTKEEPAEGNPVLAAIADCKKSSTPKSCETAALWSLWASYGPSGSEIYSFASDACKDADRCVALGALQMLHDYWTKKLNKDQRYATAEKTLMPGCKKQKEPSEHCLLLRVANGTELPEKFEEACVKGDGTWGCLFYFELHPGSQDDPQLPLWSKKACKAGFAPACTKGADAEKDDERRIELWEKGCSLDDPKGCSLAAQAYESEKFANASKAK